MKHLTKTQIGLFREQLVLREQLLSDELKATIARRQTHEDEGRAVDRGVVDLDTALGFADALREQLELNAIHAALGRMDRGTYGRCLSCGAHIPPERLRVAPEADLCHVCQTRTETHTPPSPAAP